MKLKEIKPTEISENPVQLIARDWMLVTAGTAADFNTMTASWGMIGEMWGDDVVECVVRPQRFTHQYIDRENRFTLTFFPDSMRPVLAAMGKYSGRDIDKMHYPGLEAMTLPSGQITFEGAKLVIEAEVLYSDDFDPARFKNSATVERWYNGDFHTRYIGKITHVWIPDNN